MASPGLMLQMPSCTAVLLAGAGGHNLYPLNASGTPKVLLPVANHPLLTFPLRMLEEAGITHVLVVCEGDNAAQAVRAWLAGSYSGSLQNEVVRVGDGTPAADALRQVMERIRTDDFVLISGDVVADTSLRAQLLTHYTREAVLTMLLGRRKTLATAETKPGRAPRNVDYIGLADGGERLALYVHSPETVKQLVLPPSFLHRFDAIAIRTDLVDMQVYVMHTATVKAVLAANEKLKHLEDQLIPHLIRFQLKPRRSVGEEEAAALTAAHKGGSLTGLEGSMADLSVSGLSSSSLAASGGAVQGAGGCRSAEWCCCPYLAPEGAFCRRANTLEAYTDVNRDILAAQVAARLLEDEPNPKFDNFVSGSVSMGTRANVSPASMVGADSVVEERASVKRSVVGSGCVIGAGSKVVNSVLMDDVRLGPGCQVHNCVLSSGCSLGEGVRLRDCQLAPGYAVPAGVELTEEVLPPAVQM